VLDQALQLRVYGFSKLKDPKDKNLIGVWDRAQEKGQYDQLQQPAYRPLPLIPSNNFVI